VSWIVLRARCRHCRVPISIQYPIVELLVALVTVSIVMRFGFTAQGGIAWIFAFALLALSFIDLKHWIIPDAISLPLIPIGLLAASFGITVPFWDAFIGMAAGAGVLLLVGFVYYLARGGSGMGLGDVKLLGGIGAVLGWKALPFVVFAASMQGLLASLALMAAGKKVVVPPMEGEEENMHHRGTESRERGSTEENGQQGREGAGAEAGAGAGRRESFLDAAPVEGKRAVPFGPFLSLAALEYLFFADTLLRDLLKLAFPFIT
jgi:prepilin signal peptidase PulO-like enzyme (type II secretory pathway)